MASKQPIVRQVAWWSMVPQLIVMGIIVTALYAVGAWAPIILGAVFYLALSFSVRFLVPRAHRRGVRLLRRQDFRGAIPEFQRSYDFFNRHRWVDKWRYLTLLSSSRISYREMALANIAYCYSQIGHGTKSQHYYQRTLAEFPDSEIAKSSLRMLESAQRISDSQVPVHPE